MQELLAASGKKTVEELLSVEFVFNLAMTELKDDLNLSREADRL